jgi:prepilin-type N-terminal cleavage/methylation domain-containing protein
MHRPSASRRDPPGFTLIELLVVIAVIGVLVAPPLPAAQGAREAARRAQCTNDLKPLGIARQNDHSAHSGFPSSYPSPLKGNQGPRVGLGGVEPAGAPWFDAGLEECRNAAEPSTVSTRYRAASSGV